VSDVVIVALASVVTNLVTLAAVWFAVDGILKRLKSDVKFEREWKNNWRNEAYRLANELDHDRVT